LSLLLVVVLWNPPSKIFMLSSSTMAMRLPWRRTNDSPVSSLNETVVLPDDQFWFAWMAAFIWVSILRIWSGVPLTLLIYTVLGSCAVCLCQFVDWLFSGVLCEILWRFGGLCLTLVRMRAKTTRAEHIYKVRET